MYKFKMILEDGTTKFDTAKTVLNLIKKHDLASRKHCKTIIKEIDDHEYIIGVGESIMKDNYN